MSPTPTAETEQNIIRSTIEPRAGTSICIIVENQPVPLDRRVWLQARALHQAGYRVSIISPKGQRCESSHSVIEGIEIYRYRAWTAERRSGYLIEYAWALAAQLYLASKIYRSTRFSVLQGCNPPDTIFLIALLFKPFGVKFVFDHHDLSPELYEVKFGRRGLIYKTLCLFERLSFRIANFSLATNESYRQIAIDRGKMKPEQVAVVQTCPDLGEVSSIPPNFAPNHGKRYLVVYVGCMEIQDGVRLLIESIEHLVKQRSRNDAHFVLIGSGSEVPRLKTMVRDAHLEHSVEFTGLLPHERVGSYISRADVCVAPDPLNALNDRCTMIKNLEYMAFGKPVVLYDLKEGRLTLGSGALYARPNNTRDFADKIERLLESETLRETLGGRGRTRVEEELNWGVQSARLVDAFAKVLREE